MALYPNGPTLDLTNKVIAQNYDKAVNQQYFDTLEYKDLLGSSVNAAIYQPKNLTGTAGNTTTIQIADLTKYDYTYENEVTLLKEKAMNYFPEQVKLNQVDHTYVVGSAKSIEAQALAFSDLEAAKQANVTKMAEWFTISMFSQLSGTASDLIAKANGFNDLIKPTNTLTAAIGTDMIADVIAMAKKNRFQVINGLSTGSNFILYLSPADEGNWRKALNAQTFDLSKAIAIANKKDEALSKDVLGSYYGVELRSNYYVPEGKAYLMGGQALTCVYGSEYEGNPLSTGTYDIDNTHIGIKTSSVIGLKKTQFNGKDFGVIEVNVSGKGK